jgi:hypothetical protein
VDNLKTFVGPTPYKSLAYQVVHDIDQRIAMDCIVASKLQRGQPITDMKPCALRADSFDNRLPCLVTYGLVPAAVQIKRVIGTGHVSFATPQIFV